MLSLWLPCLCMLLCFQHFHNLLSSDEPISMAKVESLIRPEQLNPGETHRFLLLILVLWWHRQWYYQRHIVTRVSPHDFTCSYWPIQPLYPPTRVLDHKHCSINSLAIPHLLTYLLAREIQEGKKKWYRDKGEWMNMNEEREGSVVSKGLYLYSSF